MYNIKTHILTNFETQVVYNFVWTHKVYGRSFDTTVPLQTHNNKQQQQYFSQSAFSRMVAKMFHFVIYVKAWSRVLIRAASWQQFPGRGIRTLSTCRRPPIVWLPLCIKWAIRCLPFGHKVLHLLSCLILISGLEISSWSIWMSGVTSDHRKGVLGAPQEILGLF